VLPQIWAFVKQTYLHFDLGNTGPPGYESEGAVLLAGLPTDLTLAVSGMVLGLLIGVVAGSICARHPRTKRARVLMAASAVALSTPPYLFGFAVLILFAPGTGYLLPLPLISPLQDYTLLSAPPDVWVRALWVPALCVATPLAAQVMRMTESGLRETLDLDTTRSARAKGLTENRIVRRHALPLTASPILALAGANSVNLLTNIALMESAFNLPGAFHDLQRAVLNGDLGYLQALTVECAVFIVVANLLVDLVQMLLDPRVRA
jgi:peptide/nickel transport system permease protein